jgi:serine/threonine protein kinase
MSQSHQEVSPVDRLKLLIRDLSSLLSGKDVPVTAVEYPFSANFFFHFVAEAGRGTFGTVYYALWRFRSLRPIVAVKVFNATDNASDAFRRELRFLKLLSSEIGVLRLLHAGTSPMRFLVLTPSNCTLKNLMDEWKEPFPVWFVLYLGQQLLVTLKMLHTRGIVHCDVKPSNIHFLMNVKTLVEYIEV